MCHCSIYSLPDDADQESVYDRALSHKPNKVVLLENHLAGRLTHRVRAHGLGVRGEGQEGQAVEDDAVEQAVDHVLGGQQHDEHHHELGVEDQHPGDDAAHDAAAVADEPHGVGAGAGRWGGAVLGPQVAGLPLDVPGAVRRALHPTALGAPATCCEEGLQADGEEDGVA